MQQSCAAEGTLHYNFQTMLQTFLFLTRESVYVLMELCEKNGLSLPHCQLTFSLPKSHSFDVSPENLVVDQLIIP